MCSKSRYIYRYLLVLTILSLPQILLGQTTYTWIGDNSSWNASFNWSPSGVPGPADTAVVETGTTMIIDSDVEVGGFADKAVADRSAGPGWARAYEVARMAALPHLLYKEQWELKRMLVF